MVRFFTFQEQGNGKIEFKESKNISVLEWLVKRQKMNFGKKKIHVLERYAKYLITVVEVQNDIKKTGFRLFEDKK